MSGKRSQKRKDSPQQMLERVFLIADLIGKSGVLAKTRNKTQKRSKTQK